jgi:peptidyl-prolyl cis-trans isomerase B (cyclophilin B)
MLLAIIALFVFFWTMQKSEKAVETTDENLTFPQLTTDVLENERLVEMETSMGTIKIKLFEKQAPKAVENFLTYSKEGFYEGLIFHRVIEGTLIQGGDPLGTGEGGEGIWGGYFNKEDSKELYHLRGALAMVSASPGKHGSQFLIVQNNSLDKDYVKEMEEEHYPKKIIEAYEEQGGVPWLDGGETVFGQVIEGMDVVDKIAQVKADSQQKPKKDVIIKKITVVE